VFRLFLGFTRNLVIVYNSRVHNY